MTLSYCCATVQNTLRKVNLYNIRTNFWTRGPVAPRFLTFFFPPFTWIVTYRLVDATYSQPVQKCVCVCVCLHGGPAMGM